MRRIPDLSPRQVEQPTLFDTWRHHAFFTTAGAEEMDTVTADKTHRGHAIIEQVHADLKHGPLAHLPSGIFAANSAWLVLATIAFNLTRAAGVLADRGGRLAKATTATIRRTLIHVPARVAHSARRIRLHLPEGWPWEHAFARFFTITHAPPPAVTTLTTAAPRHDQGTSGRPGCDARNTTTPTRRQRTPLTIPPPTPGSSVDRG